MIGEPLSKPECCSLIREAVRTATHYYTRDLQTRALQKNVISPLFNTFLASLNVLEEQETFF